MTAMVRKQIYLEPRQAALLKQWAEETGRSESDIIREALDRWLQGKQQHKETAQ